MQNRYVGDVGDFGKYGLLRYLCSSHDGPSLSLGVAWYLVPDETHTNDGQRIQYLTASERNNRDFRECDPYLYDRLSELVNSDRRSVAAVREARIFPEGTVFYEVPLFYDALPGIRGQGKRTERRASWLRGALEATKDCDIVFLDPDNGLEAGTKPFEKRGPKYVYIQEVAQFARRASSLIIYHHSGRQGTVIEQINKRFEQLRQVIPADWSLCALQYHRGTSRVYFVLSSPLRWQQLNERLNEFLTTAWSRHFRLVMPDGPG